MGSDPRRLDGLRADEQVAARLVERATGATARAHDVGRRQGAYDVHLTYPGGRTAALEVTTHAGSSSRAGMALLGRDRLSNPGARHPSPPLVDHPRSVDPALTLLPDAVSVLLAVPHVARRAAKVAGARRVDERHLFVGIGPGGLPEPLYLRLGTSSGSLPAGAPDVPEGLTNLWLSTEVLGSPVIAWDATGGWRSYRV
ncbi:MAG TPA: hypothetical protein VES93_10420 [Ornithinibacter sp.]|nr:hypothetical protein [Ornithinibacter sp.]